MKQIIKINYPVGPNMGDQLNKQLIEKVFSVSVKQVSAYKSDVSGIGSSLGNYLYSDNIARRIKQFLMGFFFSHKVYVWGTGFINYSDKDNSFYRRNMEFRAVRGELTKKRVENIIGRKLDIPTCDGGILASYLLQDQPQKKFDIGIIAHFREKDNLLFQNMLNHYKNSIFIDVIDDPVNVVKKIAECKYIISSSLHGLIISDSLRVPNLHIVVTNKLKGDGYKFDDYYSGYSLDHNYVKIQNEADFPAIDEIQQKYDITDQMVEEKKEAMLKAFPFVTISL